MDASDDIVIKMSRAKALALFEWSHRFMETNNAQFTHPADPIVIDTIASELERKLPEVFTGEYPAMLEAARARVTSDYCEALGPQNMAWLQSLAYQDVSPAMIHST